jgi:hypothetical protein|tara:strand:+ start:950 stop:1174 length:225 start_codon:yes stop_codon:yes gene_type:complete
MDRLKVEGYKGLERDMNSKAIINTNRSTYESYMKSMENKKIERDQLRDTVREINTLKCEMHEIKSLLIQLMDKK